MHPLSTPPPRPAHTPAQVFLGTLREIELERVKEKLSSAIMETCLALTIFRCAASSVHRRGVAWPGMLRAIAHPCG